MARASSPPTRGQVLHLPVTGEPPFLLRIPVSGDRWAETLPPMPAGAGMSVAFCDADVEAEHEEAVALLGYRPAGVVPAAGAGPLPTAPAWVDLLVPRQAVNRWPVWRDAVLATGGRVHDLAFGPVAVQMAAAVAVHGSGR